jgi:probable HAF family extracellular repeat protein
MRAKQLVLLLTVLAATLTVQGNDTPLMIELDRRSGALAVGVSATGAVVVGDMDGGGGFYWMPTTGVIAIGGYQASNVSRDGRTIVGIARDSGGIRQAAIWVRAAEWRLLGPVAPNALPCTDFLAGATDTSDDGQVVVGYANAATSATDACASANSHAFRWEESTGMRDLGSTVAGRPSLAEGVSGDGKVVVGYQTLSTGFRQGVRWVDGRQEAIPAAAGSAVGAVSTAHAANRDGSVIVGQDCRPAIADDQSAWVWTERDGTQCLLPPQRIVLEGPNSPPVVTRALAVSEDGRIVAGEQGIGAADTEAIIWIDRTPHYLKDYLRANGIPNAFENWHRTGTITGMSPDGRILVGWGAPIGGFRGYIVILGETP